MKMPKTINKTNYHIIFIWQLLVTCIYNFSNIEIILVIYKCLFFIFIFNNSFFYDKKMSCGFCYLPAALDTLNFEYFVIFHIIYSKHYV